ncbi:hypothetical protein BT93_L4310 [Corymbia citriodora subsp. variegata]|uniref:Uncharacterized protein n=1 Tax=Corymbia citriodora subsp. variegata TaxID=360336 RepID=A0A8T0CKZ8_CORYI|nr:hypothetical protein BT93_L4310 [Corymbia citriodora subsp. variegata]
MDADDTVESLDYELSDEDEEGSTGSRRMSKSKSKAREHKEQLQRLQEKDPEFFQFLKEHDQELLEFDDEDIEVSDALNQLSMKYAQGNCLHSSCLTL